MPERFDVLDVETGNLYGRFPTEATALRFVRAMMDANGAAIVETMALGGRDASGAVLPVKTGIGLAQDALRAEADPLRLSQRS